MCTISTPCEKIKKNVSLHSTSAMISEYALVIIVAAITIPIVAVLYRLVCILPFTRLPLESDVNDLPIAQTLRAAPGSNLMVLMGSGGHTGEMIRLLSSMDISCYSRTYVSSSGDATSLAKAMEFDESVSGGSTFPTEYLTLERARSVGEPFLHSIYSTVKSFASTVIALASLHPKPAVLLLNGPGTSVPLAYVLFLFKFLGLSQTRIVYVESLARISKLSLSGLLVLPLADRFLVQWEQLARQYKRAEYYGILV